MRNPGDIFDRLDFQPQGLQGADRCLPSRSGPFDPDFDLANAVLSCGVSRGLRGHLRCEGRSLAGSLETNTSG